MTRTLFVIGPETTADSYRENDGGAPLASGFASWLRDARPWLHMHPEARWVRCIRPIGTYKPLADEVLLVRRRYPSKFGASGSLEARCGMRLSCSCPVGSVTRAREADEKRRRDDEFYASFENALDRDFGRAAPPGRSAER